MGSLIFAFLFFVFLWILSDICERWYTGQFRFKKKEKDSEV